MMMMMMTMMTMMTMMMMMMVVAIFVTSEAFTAAEVSKTLSGYQSCLMVKHYQLTLLIAPEDFHEYHIK
jgi:hypothetical protein